MNKKTGYCLPIIKHSKADVLSKLKEASKDDFYQKFEIWLDYINGVDRLFIDEILQKYPDKIVFVFRRQNLKKPKLNLDSQLNLLSRMQKNCLVDMDVYDQKELIAKSNNLKLKKIISYHNYKETPADEKLRENIIDIEAHTPEIIKLAAFCRTKTDALRLLKLMLELKNKGKKHIVLGMGANGTITRLFGVFWGNELTFIPESKSEGSAPGQLARAEMDTIFERIKT